MGNSLCHPQPGSTEFVSKQPTQLIIAAEIRNKIDNILYESITAFPHRIKKPRPRTATDADLSNAFTKHM